MNHEHAHPDSRPSTPQQALQDLWASVGLPPDALDDLTLTGADPALPSSFRVGTAAQTTIAAAALAAARLGLLRGGARQRVSVDMRHAAHECCNWFSIDGRVPSAWEKYSGLYPCGSGWVRIHANFPHHRDGALRLLGLPPGDAVPRDDVVRALAPQDPFAFEQAAADAGLVVAALRSFDAWDRHPHGAAVATQPLVALDRIGDAPPRRLPSLDTHARPLTGVNVIDLTRILAGPVAGRALAAYGADVMLVNAPHLPNIDAIIDTSRGKLSAHADLRAPSDRAAFEHLLRDAHVLVQGYRPGALQAAGSDTPKALPMQIIDHASGYLMALGAQAALLRQQREGGSWHVRVSLVRTGHWLRGLGQVSDGFTAPGAEFPLYAEASDSGWGRLVALRHAAVFSDTPAAWPRPSVRPGTHPLRWPSV
jgi:crotonobetainyl-CoA:carnitine CoA-transferase CaiB-like acyl-CoA transferase